MRANITFVLRICEIIVNRGYSPLKRHDFLYSLTSDCREQIQLQDRLHKFTKDVIKSRREQLKDDIEKRMNDDNIELNTQDDVIGRRKKIAFLDLLLLSKTADGEQLSDQIIREEVDTFMFEVCISAIVLIQSILSVLASN